MVCTTNVPISTGGRATQNHNLTCVTNCSNDGGYSNNPIDILTDCTSASSALGVMTSQKSKNVTLSSGAQFSLTHTGSSWPNLTQPASSNLNWSIVFSIDLQMRPDGIINTPPLASVLSPQYAIVNETTLIPILVSDVNAGDDIRCRWSLQSTTPLIDECGGACYPSSMPNGTTLSNCTLIFQGPTAGIWYAAAIQVTNYIISLKNHSSFYISLNKKHNFLYDVLFETLFNELFRSFFRKKRCDFKRFALTHLISLLQVEDFINTTSTIPMSSVPVQFLIHVISEPNCSAAPIIVPLTGCLEVTVGVSTSFNISVLDLCDPNIVGIADIGVTQSSSGMQLSTLQNSPTNASLFYKTLTWTPQANQIGPEQLCMIAYTE
jgi:hypothetical protein